jgi:hypothetical protein
MNEYDFNTNKMIYVGNDGDPEKGICFICGEPISGQGFRLERYSKWVGDICSEKSERCKKLYYIWFTLRFVELHGNDGSINIEEVLKQLGELNET